jgi:DNA-binding Lrp family transcriptional regulator
MTDDKMPRTKSIPDDQILREFANSPGPVATAPDLAERLPLSRDGVRRRLNQMVDEGRLKKRTVGANAVVYYFPEVRRDGRAPAS